MLHLLSVSESRDHKLNLAPGYKGSKIYTRTGQQVFWLGEVRSNTVCQDYKTIKFDCLKQRKLFEDPEFPPVDDALSEKSPDEPVIWLRPHEICANPKLFVEGLSRFDIRQGDLGNCWLLAALANLTMYNYLMKQVIPSEQSFDENYAGIFHFWFWQYGRWVDVVIDDRLPTRNGKLINLRSTAENEFWSALFEKAYAKLHGSYGSLKGGSISEGMEDITGGVSETYSMKKLPKSFYNILLKAYKRNTLIGCSIQSNSDSYRKKAEGLICWHAYSVTCVRFIETKKSVKIPMLRLRNPWGNEEEWNGPWSDKSKQWQSLSDEERQKVGLVVDSDGEFWMSYQDFKHRFTHVELCNLNPDSLHLEDFEEEIKKWEVTVFEGQWTKGVTAGGYHDMPHFHVNPQYIIKVVDTDEEDDDDLCTIIVALMQKNRRWKNLQYLEVGFEIYRLPEKGVPKPLNMKFFKANKPIGHSSKSRMREISKRFKLKPGSYVIIPYTSKPHEEGEFLLRVYTESVHDMIKHDNEFGKVEVDERVKDMPVAELDPTLSMFNQMAGNDNKLDWEELKALLDGPSRAGERIKDRTNGSSDVAEFIKFLSCWSYSEEKGKQRLHRSATRGLNASKDVCQQMLYMLDKDGSGTLEYNEFKEFWLNYHTWLATYHIYSYGSKGISVLDLRLAINSIGYTINHDILHKLIDSYCPDGEFICRNNFLMCALQLKSINTASQISSNDLG